MNMRLQITNKNSLKLILNVPAIFFDRYLHALYIYIYIVWWKNDGKTVDRFKVAIDMIQNIQAKMLTRKAFYY